MLKITLAFWLTLATLRALALDQLDWLDRIVGSLVVSAGITVVVLLLVGLWHWALA